MYKQFNSIFVVEEVSNIKRKQEDGTYLVEFERKENFQPDYSKLNKAYERQRNGLILLGLYFKDLWD